MNKLVDNLLWVLPLVLAYNTTSIDWLCIDTMASDLNAAVRGESEEKGGSIFKTKINRRG